MNERYDKGYDSRRDKEQHDPDGDDTLGARGSCGATCKGPKPLDLTLECVLIVLEARHPNLCTRLVTSRV
jgi:hypothetical protein